MKTRTLVEGFRVYSYAEPSRCPYCDKAKALLNHVGAFYAEFDISDEQNKAFIKGLGLRTVPQLWHGDKHIGGFDKLCDYLNFPVDKASELAYKTNTATTNEEGKSDA